MAHLGPCAEKVDAVGAKVITVGVHHRHLFATHSKYEAGWGILFAETEGVNCVGEFVYEVIHTAGMRKQESRVTNREGASFGQVLLQGSGLFLIFFPRFTGARGSELA